MTDFSKYDYTAWLGSGSLQAGCPLNATALYEHGCSPICAVDFYEDLFGHSLEPHRKKGAYHTGEYAAIALELTSSPPSFVTSSSKQDGLDTTIGHLQPERKLYGHRTTVTEGQQELYDLINSSKNDVYIAPISYAGKRRINANARFMFALCVEIDDIEQRHGISELLYTFKRSVSPIPPASYIVCSGNGVHVYWFFDKPIPMYKNTFEELRGIKNYLVENLWDKQISNLWRDPQYQSICQAFRAVGSVCKDRNKRVMAFKCGEKISIKDFNNSLPKFVSKISGNFKNKMTLAEAKRNYPTWYTKRIIKGEPRKTFKRHEGIYYNWIEKIYKWPKEGHRYNCLEALCALAVQCEIPRERLVRDCYGLKNFLENYTTREDNHFTDYDVECALRTYDNPTESAYLRNLDVISKKTGIPLRPNRRNGLKQKDHLEIARSIQQIKDKQKGTNWRDGNGRKTKKQIVINWRCQNPWGTKAECIKETGLSKPTVYKWWNE